MLPVEPFAALAAMKLDVVRSRLSIDVDDVDFAVLLDELDLLPLPRSRMAARAAEPLFPLIRQRYLLVLDRPLDPRRVGDSEWDYVVELFAELVLGRSDPLLPKGTSRTSRFTRMQPT